MNEQEKAFHYLLEDYMQIPKTWEDYQIIKNAIAENKQLKDNWNKLKEWLEEESNEYKKDSYSSEYGLVIGTMLRTLDKMQDIEGVMNE